MTWTPLTDDPARGPKAVRLAAAAAAGLRIPPSWTLAPDAPADPAGLIALAPDTRRWMLRSSSTLEDRPGRSAAGLFHSESALAVPEEITSAVARVRASAEDPAVAKLLGRTAPLTVLAQPHLDLHGWWTVELPAGADARREGWGDATGVEELARAAAGVCDLPDALAEVGVDADGPVLLQVRPAPAGRPGRPVPAPLDPLFRPLPPGQDWRWDREHAPTPLCPLLAGIFARWLDAKDPGFPVALLEAHWHEAVTDPAPATCEVAEASQRSWEEDRGPDLERRLRSLAKTADALGSSPGEWEAFTGDWLAFQDAYFAESTRAIRRWALAQPRRPGALSSTIPARRERELSRLAAARGEPDFEARLAAFLAEHGHVAIHPWDGRGVTWAEDPGPLRAEIARRSPDPDPDPGPAPDDLASRILRRCEDDDELLARAYAIVRRAAFRLERALGLAARPGEILEIVEPDLTAILDHPDPPAWSRAVARGRSLAARWAAWSGETADGPLRGRGASAGRARGPVVRAGSAREADLPPGAILVVPTILPSDAPVFARAAGIVCEAGDTLGHATILAREHGIPLVVGVADARLRLRDAGIAEVDGDRGEVRALPRGSSRPHR